MDVRIRCTSCGAMLVVHCSSPTCHWQKCPTRACAWEIYDLERGARSDRSGHLEQLGRPPVAPEDGLRDG